MRVSLDFLVLILNWIPKWAALACKTHSNLRDENGLKGHFQVTIWYGQSRLKLCRSWLRYWLLLNWNIVSRINISKNCWHIMKYKYPRSILFTHLTNTKKGKINPTHCILYTEILCIWFPRSVTSWSKM